MSHKNVNKFFSKSSSLKQNEIKRSNIHVFINFNIRSLCSVSAFMGGPTWVRGPLSNRLVRFSIGPALIYCILLGLNDQQHKVPPPASSSLSQHLFLPTFYWFYLGISYPCKGGFKQFNNNVYIFLPYLVDILVMVMSVCRCQTWLSASTGRRSLCGLLRAQPSWRNAAVLYVTQQGETQSQLCQIKSFTHCNLALAAVIFYVFLSSGVSSSSPLKTSVSLQNSSMPYSFSTQRGILVLLLFYTGLLPFVPLGESLLQFYLPRIINRSVCRAG